MLNIAEHAAELLGAVPGVDLLRMPELSVIAFRAAGGDWPTRAIFDALHLSRIVHVSSTTIGGSLYVRLAFLSPRTTTDILHHTVRVVRQALETA